MDYFSKVSKSGSFKPDYVASSVSSIDFKLLKNRGIKCVAFDIDGTLTKNGSLMIDLELAKLIKTKLDLAGIKTRFLASNSKRKLNNIAKILGAFEIHQPEGYAGKPSKKYYESLLVKTGLNPDEVAMIGDRLLQDTWGANTAGLVTVLVALNPKYSTLRDKLIFRQWWQPIFVRRKISKKA
jgi:HAD superfamily phosphatase (TIGR01668 family)